MAKRELLVGAGVGGAVKDPQVLDADVFTTHGVILGMTGSGKTGLAVVLLEELARKHVPLLICDLKGDLTNLLLNFPGLQAASFAPWVPESVAQGDRQGAAEVVAGRWREGLTSWSLGENEIREVRDGITWQLLTPGSGIAPVNLLPALDVPLGYDPDVDTDGARSQMDGTAAGILALVDRGGDPLSNRDHVLLSTLLDNAWRKGQNLTFSDLIKQIAEPPVTRFGVLDAETFYPRREREELVKALNTVLASPSFAAWTKGVPLAAEKLIGSVQNPKGTILYLAHLAEREKLSFLTLLFSNVLSWARSQSGTEALRVLLYLDEVQGIVPPTAIPPTKPPLLTLLKQGRAFGAGVILATQNPVDLDYKALGNMGVKLIGRLDTENDRRRALEGLDITGGDTEAIVANLKQRQFLLSGARVGTPRVMSSRWAMSYLRGPLTLAELKPLVAALGGATPSPTTAGKISSAALSAAPPLIQGVDQLFATGDALHPAVLVEARVFYRKASPVTLREISGFWVAPIGEDRVFWERMVQKDLPALAEDLAEGARLEPLPGNTAELLRAAGKEFSREIGSKPKNLLWHRSLKLVQEEGESDETFRERCQQTSEDQPSSGAEPVRSRYEEKLRRIEDKIQKEQLELAQDEGELAARQRQQTLTVAAGVGDALLRGLGALLGGRRSGLASAARTGLSTAKQVGEKHRMAERARGEVEESQQTLTDLQAEKSRLEAEMQTEVARVDDAAKQKAATCELLALTPGARDITVRRVALVWLPKEELV